MGTKGGAYPQLELSEPVQAATAVPLVSYHAVEDPNEAYGRSGAWKFHGQPWICHPSASTHGAVAEVSFIVINVIDAPFSTVAVGTIILRAQRRTDSIHGSQR